MKNSPLIDKSKDFALEIIKVCNFVKQNKKETVLTNQLIRSGTFVKRFTDTAEPISLQNFR